jgi:hypothetical protein
MNTASGQSPQSENRYLLKMLNDIPSQLILKGDSLDCHGPYNFAPSEAFNGRTVVALIDGRHSIVGAVYTRGNWTTVKFDRPGSIPLVVKSERLRITEIVLGVIRQMARG